MESSKRVMLWREIERVLANSNQSGLDVLQIRQQSDMLKQETPKTLTSILYHALKEKHGILEKRDKPLDYVGNKKPLWFLRSNQPHYQQSYHSNTFNHNENQNNNHQSHYNYNQNHAQNMHREHHNDYASHGGHSYNNRYNDYHEYDRDDYYNHQRFKPGPRRERRVPQYRKKEDSQRNKNSNHSNHNNHKLEHNGHEHENEHHRSHRHNNNNHNHHDLEQDAHDDHYQGSSLNMNGQHDSRMDSNNNQVQIDNHLNGMNGQSDLSNNNNNTDNTNAQIFAYNDASFYNPPLPLQNVPQSASVAALQTQLVSSPVSPLNSPPVLAASPYALHSPQANANNTNPYQFATSINTTNNSNNNNNGNYNMNGSNGYQTSHKVNTIGGRGRGRGRGYIKRAGISMPSGYIKPRRTKLEVISEVEHKFNVNAADFVPSGHSQVSSPVSSSPASPSSNPVSAAVAMPGVHISTLIATPFKPSEKKEDSDDILKEYYAKRKGDCFYTGYLYHINIHDANAMSQPESSETLNGYTSSQCQRYSQMCPLGIFMPCKIPDYCLQHIKFPIQIVANCERQYKQYIDEQRKREESKEQDEDAVNMNDVDENKQFEFKKEDRMVTLELIPQTIEQVEHRIHQEAFSNFAKANSFIWTKLNQLSLKTDELQICDENNLAKRTYLVVPLKYEQDDFGLEIDYETIKIICLGALGKYNGAQWRKKRNRTCSLKGELVEIRNEKERKLCISYGIHGERYKQIKDDKAIQHAQKANVERKRDEDDDDDDDDDTRSIASFYSFANESVVERFEAMRASNAKALNPRSVKNKDKNVIITMKEDSFIPNVLDAQQRTKTMAQLRKLRSYEHLERAYPCGIRSNLWYSLKNIPSILFHLEKWFNLIDLQQLLAKTKTDVDELGDDEHKSPYKEASSLDLSSCIDLSLLYHALHRSKSSTSATYQIFNCLGAYICKFLATLYKFSTDPTCDYHGIDAFVKQITQKTSVRHSLYSVASKLNLESYAILHDFEWRKWNPPQFQDRRQHSLYDGTTETNLLLGDDGQFLSAYLLQSIIGAFWSSVMNQNHENPMSLAIDTTLQFMTHIGILPESQPYHVADEIRKLRQIQIETDSNLKDFKVRISGDALEMNTLLAVSLNCVTTKCTVYKEQGLTFKRLEMLGDAVLDMLIMWYMYCIIGDNKFPKQIANKQEKHGTNWKQALTDMRHILVNDNYLGYLFLQNVSFIKYHDPQKHEEILRELKEYTEAISQKENEGDLDEAQPLIEGLQTQKSPGGYVEDDCKQRGVQKWQLECTAPQILGQTFEAVLGAIFLGSNDNVFTPRSPFIRKVWNLRYCVEYLLRFMMENEKIWDKHFKWDQWVGKQAAKNNINRKAIKNDIV